MVWKNQIERIPYQDVLYVLRQGMVAKMIELPEKKPGATLSRRGFTLIELLVVLAVLAVLMAILVPVFVQVRERSRQTTCLSNLRQLGSGMAQYVTDADEMFPQGWEEHTGTGWAGKIYPYIQQQTVFTCPDDPTEAEADSLFTFCSYGFNSNLSGYYLKRPLLGLPTMPLSKPCASLSVLSNPSATVLLFEVENDSLPLPLTVSEASSASGDGFDDGAGMWGIGITDGLAGPNYATGSLGGRTGSARGSNALVYSTPRHTGGANYLACDGHTKWLRPESVSGGINAPAANCLQGTDSPQPDGCRGPSGVSPANILGNAAGTESGKQVLTFSSL